MRCAIKILFKARKPSFSRTFTTPTAIILLHFLRFWLYIPNTPCKQESEEYRTSYLQWLPEYLTNISFKKLHEPARSHFWVFTDARKTRLSRTNLNALHSSVTFSIASRPRLRSTTILKASAQTLSKSTKPVS